MGPYGYGLLCMVTFLKFGLIINPTKFLKQLETSLNLFTENV